MTVWTYVVIVYAVGFLVAPFVMSLIDGWPFVRPRLDGLDMSATFFLSLLWPLVLVVWGLFVWWVLCSSVGTMVREAIKSTNSKGQRDDD